MRRGAWDDNKSVIAIGHWIVRKRKLARDPLAPRRVSEQPSSES
jgi:hypothetical protein